MIRKLRISKIYFLGLVFTFMLFLCTGREVYTHLTMNYTYDPSGDVYVTVYEEDEILHKGMIEEGVGDFFFWGKDITGISPIHYDASQVVYLDSIQIRVHGETVAKMDAKMIMENFTPNDDILDMELTDEGVYLTTIGEQPTLLLNDSLREKIDRMAEFMGLLNLFFYVIVWTFVYWYQIGRAHV